LVKTTPYIETPYIETPAPPVKFNGQASDYLANLQSALQPLIGNLETKQALNETRIIELIKEHQPKAREIIVKQVDMPAINVGIQHKQFDQLLKNASARVPSMLVGPSGSGKTHGAGQLAKALQLDYEAISCNPMTSKTDLLGYRDANGVYHDTALVRRFRDGGVLMLDEIDASNASVLTGINMATSNGEMATPEGMIEKHVDFILVAGANTWGNGATPEFVGRNKLDLATKKRFFMLDWDYDESIELQISDAVTPEETELVNELQKYRATARSLELRVSITPRDSIYGVRLLRAGTDKKTILKGLVFADLDKSTISKIKG
jgi:MoxR-like ATPase